MNDAEYLSMPLDHELQKYNKPYFNSALDYVGILVITISPSVKEDFHLIVIVYLFFVVRFFMYERNNEVVG